MVKRIQCFLTDEESSFMERAKGILRVESDYALVKLAIQELCHRCGADRGCEGAGTTSIMEVPEPEPQKLNSTIYVAVAEAIEDIKSAKYECGECGLPLPTKKVETDKNYSCPRCGSKKAKRR